MKQIYRVLLIVCALAFAGGAAAESKEERRIADATDVVDQLLRIPEQSIPPSLLSRAYGIAVIPNVVKAGFVFGARAGKGVLVVRQPDNTWSNPSFVRMTGGSIGWQAGVQSTDIILVFKTRRSVDGITKGKFTLGADASVAAGPVGRHTGLATDIQFEAEVFSYSRSRGLFAGIALEGAGITIDKRANAAFYARPNISAGDIFTSSGNAAPAVANNFVQLLTAQTRRLPQQPAMASGVAAPEQNAQPKPKVRTFGIGSPDEGEFEQGEVARQPR